MSLSKDLISPIKQKLPDSYSLDEFISPEFQSFCTTPPTTSRKRNNLQVSSSRFTTRNLVPLQFLPEPSSLIFDSTDVTHSSVQSESISGYSGTPIVEHLDLANFKVKACLASTQHNHKHCPYFHNAKDRKRIGLFYSSDLCEFAEKEILLCPNGDACLKAHNRVEQLYRPDKYKSKFCTFYPNNLEKCEYGHFCSFAHSETDIVIELIHNYEYDDDFYMFHFKTIWCPFNLTQHDKALCVYAHNWQDFRRRPDQNVYDPTPCTNWKSTDFILNYDDGCPYKEKCNKCHGWKEHEYHPMNYKVKGCPAGKNCQKGRDCPHYHVPREKSPQVANRMFRYVPRNRIITNTFKVRSEDRLYSQAINISGMFMSPMTISPYKNYQFDQEQLSDPNYSGYLMVSPARNYVQSMNDLSMGRIEETIEPPRKYSFDNLTQISPQQDHSGLKTVEEEPQSQTGDFPELVKMPQVEVKPKRWSLAQEQRLQAENDRMFRDIIMSPAIKKKEPERKTLREERLEKEGEDNVIDNTIIEKILE